MEDFENTHARIQHAETVGIVKQLAFIENGNSFVEVCSNYKEIDERIHIESKIHKTYLNNIVIIL